MEKTIEQKVAETILQKPLALKVGEETYEVKPPSLATLILASAEISRLPEVKMNPESLIAESLANIKDYRPLADMLAILILGAKGLKSRRIEKVHRLFGLVTVEKEVEVDEKAALSARILEEWSLLQMREAFTSIVGRMGLVDFFALTVSLREVNMLRRTRETGTTASGQSSPEQSRPTD